MIKKIELEIDCTEIIKQGFTHVAFENDGCLYSFKEEPCIENNLCWYSKNKQKQHVIKNWRSLSFKIAQERPIWLTKEYEERLTERGWKYVWCMPEGIWVASISEPSNIDGNWVLIGFETDYFDLYNDLTENPDWKESLIKLGE